MSETKFHHIQNHSHLVLYIPIFKFLTTEEEAEDSGPNGSKHYHNSISS
jgi:hypothetical protein